MEIVVTFFILLMGPMWQPAHFYFNFAFAMQALTALAPSGTTSATYLVGDL